MYGYTVLENNRWVVANTKLSPDFEAIERTEDGMCTYPNGLAIQEAEELAEVVKAELKLAKVDALNAITVTTTNSNTFDGNETARGNMTSAILASEVIGKTEDTWKLADNTSAVITITELKEALALSIQEVGRIVMVTSKEEL